MYDDAFGCHGNFVGRVLILSCSTGVMPGGLPQIAVDHALLMGLQLG